MTPVEASDRRRSFCAGLKSERERRGKPLEAIADATKIKGSLLDALERADLSRWPKGIYRRSFFSAYVTAIGLPAEPTVSEFLDVFSDVEPPRLPENAPAGAAVSTTVEPTATNLRLFFASSPVGAVIYPKAQHELQTRLVAAVVDVMLVGLVAWACSAVVHVNPLPVALGLGAACYFVATWQRMSPSLQLLAWLIQLRRSIRGSQPAATHVQTFEPGALPYNVHAPTAAPTLRTRLADAIGGRSLIREYVERLSESDLTFKSQRRRDLASVRRSRAEAANRSTADELSIM